MGYLGDVKSPLSFSVAEVILFQLHDKLSHSGGLHVGLGWRRNSVDATFYVWYNH